MKLYDILRKEEEGVLLEREKEVSPRLQSSETSRARIVLTKKSLIRIVVWGIVAVGIYLGGIALSRVKVTITERRIPIVLSDTQLEFANESESETEGLSFQAMIVDTTITRQLYGSALTTINTKAKGTVVFFNEYSTKSQTVKKGTTLTATNGKRYTTQAQATVPGYKTVDKKKVAGTSPSIEILAADVGDEYNSTGTTLSVTGWANASKTFYARSAEIVGGESGIRHTLTDTERAEAVETLQAQLIERLKRESRTQIPDGFITFPEFQFPIIDTDSFVLQGGSVSFPASMSGSMVSYLIPRGALERAIAKKGLSEAPSVQVSVPDVGKLSFDLASAVPADKKTIPNTITVTVSGEVTVIVKVPVDKIKEQLAGKPRRTFNEVLETIPEIDTARFSLFPFWAPRFPHSWNMIDVITR
ncbi:hypothetical protein IT401_02770 [Candidatus Nomurabacteria bacterium]|nr:hypothetical protein [Candidatus Nomurabacteria bacterium]